MIETYNRYILWCDGAGGVGHGEVAASWSQANTQNMREFTLLQVLIPLGNIFISFECLP